jgi:hypothetical protein
MAIEEKREMAIDSPLIIVFENHGNIQTHIYPADMDHKDFGTLIAALVRHVANAFKVHENDVWVSVDEERYNPTTPVSEIKLN